MDKILEQDEIDALLRGLPEDDIEPESHRPDSETGAVPFDLSTLERIPSDALPALEMVYGRFARLAANALAQALHRRVGILPISMTTHPYGEFMDSLPVHTALAIFKMAPLRGHGLLAMDSPLVFALVEHFFGGGGSPRPRIEHRDFTPIEQALVDRVARSALTQLQESWKPVREVHCQRLRTEATPQFTRSMPPSEPIRVASFEVTVENAAGSLLVCLPCATIAPLRRRLQVPFQSECPEAEALWSTCFKERLTETPVELLVQLGRTTITGRQLLELKIGDLLLLDTDKNGLLTAEVEGVRKFYGRPGRVKGNQCFQVVKTAEIRSEPLRFQRS